MGEHVASPVASQAAMSRELVRIPAKARHASTFMAKATEAGKYADILTHIIVLYMLLRTLSLVYQRKNGQVGPFLLAPFVKLWAIWGLAYFFSLPLSLYLAPFGMSWLVSVLRAVVITAISYGSTLPVATYVYDVYVHPFLDAREPEIEQQLVVMREKWTVLKQQLKVTVEDLWKQYNIGGIQGIFGTGRGEQEVAKQQADEFDPQTGQRVRNPRLPDGRSQEPFSGADRPDNVAEAAYRGVLIPPKSATPKAAYTDSRAFRETFRKRTKGTVEPSPKPDDAS